MKVTVERPSESEAVLNVEFEWNELEKASDRAYRKLAERYTVPGFRKGHAPRTMLERMVGKETIYQEGLDELIESSYRDAIRQNDLTPLAQPQVEPGTFEMGQPYSYTARVAVLPPVKLGDYKSIRVEQPSAEVSDQDVQDTLERIREDQAAWVPVERLAQLGDKVTVDLKLTVGDRTVSDLHDNEFELTGERVGIFSGMDAQIVGMSEGESKEFDTTIPEDYANTELAGKQAHYEVTVKGVKQRELPEIDDELAKTAGNYDTLDALREAIRTQLQQQRETEARRTYRENVLKAATDQAQVEIPEVLAHEEVHTMMDEQRRMLEQSRLSLEQYLEMLGKTEEQYEEDLKPEATERVKRELVLDAVADAEHIEVTQRELESWLELIAAMGGTRRRLRDLNSSQRAAVAGRLRRDKAGSRLVEIATENAGGGTTGEAGATPAATSDQTIRESAGNVAQKMDEIEASQRAASGAPAASGAEGATSATTGNGGRAAKPAAPAQPAKAATAQEAGSDATAGSAPAEPAGAVPPTESDV